MNTSSLISLTTRFGVNAYILRPQCFTEATGEDRAHKKEVVDFGSGQHGRHMWVGKAVAFMELNKPSFDISIP